MNRPDPESPDQGANQDDAVWLDLVARLQGETPTPPFGPDSAAPATDPQAAVTPEPPAGRAFPPTASSPARKSSFSDFDPLGLSGERQQEFPATEPARAGRPEESGYEPGPRDYVTDDPAEGFVPEDPPSLAGTEPLTMLAWLGAIGGPMTLLLFAMFWRAAPLLAILGVIAGFVAAVGYLIMRLPEEKNDSDDGARV